MVRGALSAAGSRFALCPVPFGWLGTVAGEGAVQEIVSASSEEAVRRRIAERCPAAQEGAAGLAGLVACQLAEYFRGQRHSFVLPLAWEGLSPFAADVLRTLCSVPYGTTVTYGQLAALSGHPRAARAVGRVMAGNPFPIVVPCHRVTACGGKLGGYSGGAGVVTKEWLLRLERR